MLGVFINFFLKLLKKIYHTYFIYFQINPFGNNICRRWSGVVVIFISLPIDYYIRKLLIIHINRIL
jgi:hypothetical protein